jgi:Flp pilus assembly protein TadG
MHARFLPESPAVASALARCERGYLAYTASVIIPLLLVVAAVSIDGAQYYSARKMLQSSANQAAASAYDARKRGLDPQKEAFNALTAGMGALARMESLSIQDEKVDGSRRVAVQVHAKLILPVTTGILGFGVTADITGSSNEGRKAGRSMVEDARSTQVTSSDDPMPVQGVVSAPAAAPSTAVAAPTPASPPPPPPPRVLARD